MRKTIIILILAVLLANQSLDPRIDDLQDRVEALENYSEFVGSMTSYAVYRTCVLELNIRTLHGMQVVELEQCMLDALEDTGYSEEGEVLAEPY